MTLPKRYEILRGVVNDFSRSLQLAEKPKQVWSLIDEDKFKELGLKHNVTAFIEDSMHDWRWEDGKLFFYAHSGGRGDLHDLVLIYER